MSFQIFTAEEIASFRAGGKILRGCLDMLAPLAVAGVTTKHLDALAETYIRDHGGEPAFMGYHGYPATLCTSVNEECVHGIPGERILQDGDIVSIDCGVRYHKLITDACVTVPVGKISPKAAHLLDVTKGALEQAVDVLKAGITVGDLSATIQKFVEAGKCTIIRPLTGHGLSTSLHAYPDIPNYGRAGSGPVFPAHTVIAVEPIVALGAKDVKQMPDRWTLETDDGSLAAHFEHTLLILEDGCEVIA